MNSVLEIAQRLAAAGCKQPHPDSEIVSERMLNLSALFDFIGNIAAAGCFKSLAEEVAELEKRVAGSAAYRAALTSAAEICAAKVLDRMNAFDNGCWSCAEAIRGELQTDLPDMTESGWTPEQALRFYAEGRHFDVVNARTRILDTGAVASDALKGLSEGYAASKGCGDPSDSTTATALRLLRKRIPSHGTYAEEMIDALRILELALTAKPPSAGVAISSGSAAEWTDQELADLLGIEVTRIESRNEAAPDGYRISGFLGRSIVTLMREAERRLARPAKEGWIATSERLPTHEYSVLLFVTECAVAIPPFREIGIYNTKTGRFQINNGDDDVEVWASHWADLPEPPNATVGPSTTEGGGA
jgi:hypothetical protein